jgi:hypothetical protein
MQFLGIHIISDKELSRQVTEAQTIWRQLNNAIINRPGLAEKIKKNRLK